MTAPTDRASYAMMLRHRAGSRSPRCSSATGAAADVATGRGGPDDGTACRATTGSRTTGRGAVRSAATGWGATGWAATGWGATGGSGGRAAVTSTSTPMTTSPSRPLRVTLPRCAPARPVSTDTSRPSAVCVARIQPSDTLTVQARASGGPSSRTTRAPTSVPTTTDPNRTCGSATRVCTSPSAVVAASATYWMSLAAISCSASHAPAASGRLSLASRSRNSITAPRRLNMFSSAIAARRSAGIGWGRTRNRPLRAMYNSPCISTSRLGVWCGLRSRTRSKTYS